MLDVRGGRQANIRPNPLFKIFRTHTRTIHCSQLCASGATVIL